MKRISWILTIPLVLVVLIFSIANRHLVDLDLWPLALSFSLPVFVLMLGTLFVGFLAGGTVAWLSGAKSRQRGRESRFRSNHLEREVIRLKREVERAKESGLSAPPAAPGAASRRTGNLPAVSTGR